MPGSLLTPLPQVGRSSLLVGNLKKKYAQELLAEKLPQQDNTTTTDSEMEEPYMQGSARPPKPSTTGRGHRLLSPPPSTPRPRLSWLRFSLWVSLRAPQNPKRRGTPRS